MAQKIKIKLFEMVSCLANSIDLVDHSLVNHHHRVAFIAEHVGRCLGLSHHDLKILTMSGMLHDVGALSLDENLDEFYFDLSDPHRHAEIGYELLKQFSPLREVADCIRFHHLPWNNGKGRYCKDIKVPKISHVLHLAERIAVLIGDRNHILDQSDMFETLVENNRGNIFEPETADAFLSISQKEAFWFELTGSSLKNYHLMDDIEETEVIDYDQLLDFTDLFSQVIDFRSRFTATHSSGVAASASALAKKLGLDSCVCNDISIAGKLHDIGKLAIPRSILEKKGKLTTSEYNIIKSHPFHSYRILKEPECLGEIASWASFHHESPNGSGYPFRLKGKQITIESRIIAMADIFTALAEDRPYRGGMNKVQILSILDDMAGKGDIDSDCLSMLKSSYDDIDGFRLNAQSKSLDLYNRLQFKLQS